MRRARPPSGIGGVIPLPVGPLLDIVNAMQEGSACTLVDAVTALG